MISHKDAFDLFLEDNPEKLYKMANELTKKNFGQMVYLRGLIELSNYCKKNCQYCGIRKENKKIERYRLSIMEIQQLVQEGFKAGLRSFVLQGGEDSWFTARKFEELIILLRRIIGSDAALTLSIGERSIDDYRRLRNAGVDRFLMRFETSDPELYERFHQGQPLKDRLKSIRNLQQAGFEVGSGFMTGLPGETTQTLMDNALLCYELKLDMVGIGPFIPHPQTPLRDHKPHGLEKTLRACALVRLLLPKANLPATTAAGSLDHLGREKMLAAGANVLMPNITPSQAKTKYELYPGKICLDESGFDCIHCLEARTHLAGKTLDFGIGTSPSFIQKQGVSL